MRLISTRLAASFLLSCLALAAIAAGPLPVPPVKPGLWEARMSALDADGHEVASPELAALARLSPEARARMMDAMKGRGVSMPDANGATKACLTKELFESGGWEQMASAAGCTTNYSTLSGTSWKWHSSCTALKSESDGEAVFNGTESYRTKVTTTATVMGKTKTSTRIVQGKWLGADCGDIKPFTPTGARK
jgi:Protein of unknown function (DUF3617)